MPAAPADAPLDERLRQALRGCAPESRYLVGVSGGRDSVALLHALLAGGYRRLTVCHLDHGLRGPAARADARWVERLAGQLGLAVIVSRTDVAARAAETGQSLETAGREARHAFFAAAARRTRCRTLFLGHHADDQVETFLFRLFRGAGARGLSAMRADSLLPLPPPAGSRAGWLELRVLRPLLGVWRAEIDAYARARRLPFREDASNANLAHTRNRLRAEVIPALETAFGRGIRESIWRAADLLAAEDDWLSALTAADGPPPTRLPLAPLRAQPLAQQRRRLRAWLALAGAPGIGYREVEAVRTLLAAGPAKVNLPAGRHVRRRAGFLFVEPAL